MKKFKILESFRFIAASIVAFGHFYDILLKIPSPAGNAVDFFFVLSSFIWTIKLKDNDSIESSKILKKVFLGRFIRLLLPYVVLLLIWNIVYFLVLKGRLYSFYDFFVDIFLLQTLGLRKNIFQGSILGIAWTLGLELYIGTILFTLIYFWNKKYKEMLFFIFIVMMIISQSLMLHFSDKAQGYFSLVLNSIPIGVFRILYSYSIGGLAGLYYKKYKINFKKNKFLKYSLLEILIVLFIYLLYGRPDYNQDNNLIFSVVAAVLIIVFTYEGGIISKILEKISILGTLGYSIYLIHPIVMDIMGHFNKTNRVFYYVSILITSILFYNLVEKKFIKLKKDINNKNIYKKNMENRNEKNNNNCTNVQ